METTQQFETMPALRRKRPKMAGEDDLKRLGEAELLARLAENARRLKIMREFSSDLTSRNLVQAGLFVSWKHRFHVAAAVVSFRGSLCSLSARSCRTAIPSRLIGLSSAK